MTLNLRTSNIFSLFIPLFERAFLSRLNCLSFESPHLKPGRTVVRCFCLVSVSSSAYKLHLIESKNRTCVCVCVRWVSPHNDRLKTVNLYDGFVYISFGFNM